MSLKDPSKKMSKSDPASCLFIDDSPEEIKAKIARATTDSGSEISYDPSKKPGLSNLIEIAAALRQEPHEEVVKKFQGKNYAEFKKGLGELVSAHFADFREKKKKLMAKPETLVKILNDSSKKAAKIAEKKMEEVKQKVGLAP
jgi:tryptophanyl-tRNA synthetase